MIIYEDKMREEKLNVRPKIIAIDFDDTIALNSFPDISKATINGDAKTCINKLYEEGYYIIIWTCRYLTEHLLDCKNFLDENEIRYNSINENYTKLEFSPEPKVYYDYLIDNKDHFTVEWLQEYYKIHTLFCESDFFEKDAGIKASMKEHFYRRTINHIEAVQMFYAEYCAKKNIELAFDLEATPTEFSIWEHDSIKFEEPELSPYICITWNYLLKDLDQDFDVSEELKIAMNKATEHHVKNSTHHPEYWMKDKSKPAIPMADRDVFNPDNGTMIDVSETMPESALIEMCADWCAMSQERRNTPFEWADKVIGHRWFFGEEKTKFIYDILNIMWKK